MINERTIHQVQAIDTKEVVSKYIKLNKADKAPCPFHNEKTASFSISPKGIYKCFGCGEGGVGGISFVMKHQNVSFPEAIIEIANQFNIIIEYDEEDRSKSKAIREGRKAAETLLSKAYREYRNIEHAETVLNWISTRGISSKTSKYFEIGYASKLNPITKLAQSDGILSSAQEIGLVKKKGEKTYDALINRITIPIHDHRGQLLGFAGRLIEGSYAKYVNPKESWAYHKSQVLYNLNRAIPHIKASKQSVVYLCEGYFDVIGPAQAGVENIIASCGTALTKEQAKIISRFAKRCVIWYDGDKAGWKATFKALQILADAKIQTAVLNIPGKDPDDFVQSLSDEKLTKSKLVKRLESLQKHPLEWLLSYLFYTEYEYVFESWENLDLDFLKSLADVEQDGEELIITSTVEIGEFIIDQGYKFNEYEQSSDQLTQSLQEFMSVLGSFDQVAQNEYLDKLKKKTGLNKTQLKQMLKGAIINGSKNLAEGIDGKNKLPADVDPEDFEKYGFYERHGCYHSLSSRRGWAEVSNFVLDILYHVKTGNEEAYRLIKIKNIHGFETTINMNTDDFVSLSSFRKLIARRGNFLWKGAEEDLIRLQDKLQREEKPTLLIDVLGFHPRGNFFAFCNGLIDTSDLGNSEPEFIPTDEYGIVNFKDQNYFIPANSKMYADKDELFVNYKKFIYKHKNIELGDWFKLFHKTYGDNALIGFSFYIASIFSNTIFNAMGRRFPILNLYGQRGSGKGAYAQSILALLGEPQDQIMLGGSTTAVAFMRSFAQFRNAIVWLDEYKNGLHKKIIEQLKNLYDRIGYKRGRKDHSFDTDYVPVQSACILSGQEMPTIEPALFQRVILLIFEGGTRTPKAKENFRTLRKMEKGGLSHLTVYLLKYSQYIETEFPSLFVECGKELSAALEDNTIEDRFIDNYSCLLAVCKLILAKENLGFQYPEFLQLVVKTLRHQNYILIGNDDVSKFWDVIETLFSQGVIKEGREFELKDKKLYLKLQVVAGLYMKELRQRNDPNALEKSTLEHYLQLDKRRFVKKAKRKFSDGTYTWCMEFDYPSLDISLISFKEGTTMDEKNDKYVEMGIPVDTDKKDDLPF